MQPCFLSRFFRAETVALPVGIWLAFALGLGMAGTALLMSLFGGRKKEGIGQRIAIFLSLSLLYLLVFLSFVRQIAAEFALTWKDCILVNCIQSIAFSQLLESITFSQLH